MPAPGKRSRRFCLLLRCVLLAATLNRSEKHADPETEDSQVEDLCTVTMRRAGLSVAVMSPKPTVAKTVTVKYSASVQVSECTLKLPRSA